MKVTFRKAFGALRPVDEDGERALRSFRNGDLVQLEIKRPRNLKHMRKFFALMQLVYENQERYATVEALVNAIKISIGHYDVLALPNGDRAQIPKSIAFHAMDQVAFEKFYDQVIKLVVVHFLPHVTEEFLERKIQDLVRAEIAA